MHKLFISHGSDKNGKRKLICIFDKPFKFRSSYKFGKCDSITVPEGIPVIYDRDKVVNVLSDEEFSSMRKEIAPLSENKLKRYARKGILMVGYPFFLNSMSYQVSEVNLKEMELKLNSIVRSNKIRKLLK